ncbi:unnamed protein product, partial [Rotaria magnacalcarata]
MFDHLSNRSKSSESSIHSRAMFKSGVLLSQENNIKIDEKFIQWQLAETTGNIINTLSKVCQALSNSNIVGPILSREAHLIADFGKTIRIPVISYSVIDPDLSTFFSYNSFG